MGLISKKTAFELLATTAIVAVIMRLFFFTEWMYAADKLLKLFG